MSDGAFPIDRKSLLEHAEGIRQLAGTLLFDGHDSDDVSQEALLHALRAPAPRTSLGAWLNGVVRNLSRGLARREKRRAERERRAARPEAQPSTFAVVERVSEQRRVLDGVLSLDEPYRAIIVLRFFEDLAPCQIADRLGVPVETVRTRLKRGLALLRTRLTPEHGADEVTWSLALLPLIGLESKASMKGVGAGLLMATKVKVAITALGLMVGVLATLTWSPWEGPVPSPALMVAGDDRGRENPPQALPAERSDPAESLETDEGVRPLEASPNTKALEHESFSTGDLRRLLFSARRLDQVRAIVLLLAQATPEAIRVLLDAFLTSSDPILLALLEEAMLKSSIDLVPDVMKALAGSTDPQTLARLAGMLTQLALTRPDLEQSVVGLFIEALEDSNQSAEHAKAVEDALIALGIRALEPLKRYLADAHSDSQGAGAAALVLSRLDAAHGNAIREALREGFDAMRQALDDPARSAAEKEAVRKKIGSIAWAAGNRPPEEQDLLARDLVEGFTHATDSAEAGTLAWGIANLKGLSDEARLQTVQSILTALPDQTDSARRQSYVWAVDQIVSAHYDGSRELDGSFYDIVNVAQEAWDRFQNDPSVSAQLRWLLAELRAHEQKPK